MSISLELSEKKTLKIQNSLREFGSLTGEPQELEEGSTPVRIAFAGGFGSGIKTLMRAMGPVIGEGLAFYEIILDSPEWCEADGTAKELLKKADAIVFVWNATRPLTRDEKQYLLEHFAGAQRRNLFLAVNLFPGLGEENRTDIRDYLREVFVGPGGCFEGAQFDRRVFYVNAIGNPLTGAEKTGISELETALSDYLNGERLTEKVRPALTRIAAACRQAEQNLKKMYGEKNSSAEKQKSAELIAKLQRQAVHMERAFSLTGSVLQATAYDSLVRLVNIELPARWKEERVHMPAFGAADTIRLLQTSLKGDEEKRHARQAELLKPLCEKLTEFLSAQISGWQRSLSDEMKLQTEQFEKDLRAETELFDQNLVRAAALFDGAEVEEVLSPGALTKALEEALHPPVVMDGGPWVPWSIPKTLLPPSLVDLAVIHYLSDIGRGKTLTDCLAEAVFQSLRELTGSGGILGDRIEREFWRAGTAFAARAKEQLKRETERQREKTKEIAREENRFSAMQRLYDDVFRTLYGSSQERPFSTANTEKVIDIIR